MSASNAVKKARERCQLEAFRQAYADFPTGTIGCDRERPDFIIEGARKIGIEITEFDLVDGNRASSERQQALDRRRIVREAQRLYLANGGQPVRLTFEFGHISAKRRKTLPIELALFADAIKDKVNKSINVSFYNAPAEIKFALNSTIHEDATWLAAQCYSGSLMNMHRLEEIVVTKEIKAKHYEKCDAYWLLIFVDFFDRAQDQEILIDDPQVRSDIFEKIFIFKTTFNQIVQVK
jgi:hypothetical protein